MFTEHWKYLAVNAACKLDLFDALEIPKTANELANALNLHEKTLTHLLQALYNNEFLKNTGGKFSLTEKSKLLTENHPESLKYACMNWAGEHLTAWQNLDYSIKTGKSAFENLYQSNFFDYLDKHPEKLDAYHKAMFEYARDDYKHLPETVDFSKHKSVLDCGGGYGAVINAIKEKFPQIDCYLFDLPKVVENAQAKNIIKIGGSFFEKIPQVADAIVLSRVLHDWEDKKANLILKNSFEALPEGGTLYVIENFADKISDIDLLSLSMAVICESYERTETEYKYLLENAGFCINNVIRLNNLQHTIKSIKIMNDNYILGLHGFSAHSNRAMHNSGVALLKNGEIIFASDEERFTRVKNESLFPFNALRAMYDETGVEPEQITCVAMPDRKPIWQLCKIIKYIIETYFETGVFASNYLRESLKRTTQLKRILPIELQHCKTYFIEHHLAHAASAFYSAPWEESSIVTVDGSGDFSMSGIFCIGKSNEINVFKRLNGFYSPGIYYMIITEILGFISGRHEGKVTGLAAFGKQIEELTKQFEVFLGYNKVKMDFYSKNIAFEIDDYISKHWVNGYNPELGTNSFAENEYKRMKEQQLSTFRIPLRGFSKEDIAFAAQKRLEDVVTEHICTVIEKTKIKNLCLAGGIFANVKMNQKIRELNAVDNLFVYPAMNDSGLSVGSALYVYHNILNNNFSGKVPTTLYLGIDCPDNTERLLEANNVAYQQFSDIENKIAQALSKNKIVAHFNGRAEYGPRALGNRSILAPATDKSINDSLNKKLHRTEFMPFAPVILEEDAGKMLIDWKCDDYNSKFMTMTYMVTAKMKELAPATVHVDGTARPQVINQFDNERLYRILAEYKRITGIPAIINTSFNLHEEPIVNTPEDALKILKHKAVDVLVINNFYIEVA
jgi:carbamoyltransferase